MYVERSGSATARPVLRIIARQRTIRRCQRRAKYGAVGHSATARPDLRIIARQRTIRRCWRRAKYGAELRIMWGVTAMHGLAPVEAKARGFT